MLVGLKIITMIIIINIVIMITITHVFCVVYKFKQVGCKKKRDA